MASSNADEPSLRLSEWQCQTGCLFVYYTTLVTTFLILFAMIGMLISLLRKFTMTRSSSSSSSGTAPTDIDNLSKYSTLVSMAFGFLSVVCDIIHIAEGLATQTWLHRHTFEIVRALADAFMFASLFTFYIHLYGRILSAFNESVFELRRRYRIVTSGMFVLVFVLNILYVASVITDFDGLWSVDSDNAFHAYMHSVVWTCFTSCYIVLFLVVVFLFLYRLHQLTMFSFTGSKEVQRVNESMSKMSIGEHPGKDVTDLLRLTTKQTNLSVLALIVFLLRFVYRVVLGFVDESTLPETAWMISYGLRDAMLLVNACVLFLGYAFNTDKYERCCGLTDSLCKHLCVCCIDIGADSIQERKIQSCSEIQRPAQTAEQNSEQSGSGCIVTIMQEQIKIS